jgi:hypothetical protein
VSVFTACKIVSECAPGESYIQVCVALMIRLVDVDFTLIVQRARSIVKSARNPKVFTFEQQKRLCVSVFGKEPSSDMPDGWTLRSLNNTNSSFLPDT